MKPPTPVPPPMAMDRNRPPLKKHARAPHRPPAVGAWRNNAADTQTPPTPRAFQHPRYEDRLRLSPRIASPESRLHADRQAGGIGLKRGPSALTLVDARMKVEPRFNFIRTRMPVSST